MDLVKTLTNQIKKKKKINLILTGGTSPLQDYRSLFKKKLDWEKVNFFYTDERIIDISNDQSNFKHINSILKKNRIINKLEHLNLGSISKKKTKKKVNILKNNLTICTLGLGDDGHYASIFLGSKKYNKLTDIKKPPKFVITERLGKPSIPRITMNLSMILLSKKIFIILNSKKKMKLFRKIISLKNSQFFSINSLLKNAKNRIIIYNGKKVLKFVDFKKSIKKSQHTESKI